jgi:hypothetical protein
MLSVQLSLAQSYIGHTVDNFAGVHGVIYNPANVVESNVKADINLFSVSAFGGSDYFGVNVSDLTGADSGFNFEADAERFVTDTNNFFLNIDAMGPSFMFNLTPKSSIGVITRARAFFNINDINGELYETIVDDLESDNDFDFNSQNLNATVHAWAEIGLAYGRVFIDNTNHMLKGGVTLKYIQGAGAAFINSPGLLGNYVASTERLTTQGSLNYGTTQGFDSDDIDFNNLSGSFGLDVGFAYQWHPDKENDGSRYYQDYYKLKVGVSVTDIGAVNYDDSEIKSYDLNRSNVDTSTYQDDVEDFLDQNYNSTTQRTSSKVNLPTALHVLVDYRLTNKFLISAQADVSMTSNDASFVGNSIINTVTLAPRLETKWFSLYAPLSFRQYGDVAFGGGFRLGPLSVGSGSIFSNLLSDSSKTTDVFVGLKIPIYRK